MRSSITAAFLLAASLSFGSSQIALAAAPLNKIVNPGFLGVTVKYAELLIGSPAMREKMDDLGFQRNVYERDGCYIDVGVKNDKVISVGMYFQPEKGCDVDVSEIVSRPGVKGSNTRFKDYAGRGDLHFTDPQLPSCNACGEGSFNATIDGVSALGMLSVQLTGDTYGPGNNRDAWRDLLRKNGIDGTRENALPSTAEDCPLRRFGKQAFSLVKDARVTGIAYSRTHRALQPECSGKTVWPLIMRGQN